MYAPPKILKTSLRFILGARVAVFLGGFLLAQERIPERDKKPDNYKIIVERVSEYFDKRNGCA